MNIPASGYQRLAVTLLCSRSLREKERDDGTDGDEDHDTIRASVATISPASSPGEGEGHCIALIKQNSKK